MSSPAQSPDPVTPLFLEPLAAGESAPTPPTPGSPLPRVDVDAPPDLEPVEAPPPDLELAPLLTLRDGVPAVVDKPAALTAACARLAAGHGPVAVDAERASSYRYGHRAYLVQIRREGSGTVLIDPIACPDLTGVQAAFAGAEWILHAANQDLPCLAELGLAPAALFDSELAGRLAGFPRVGLATMVEHFLGLRIEKDHSAADWSKRPLPDSWLRYAALDVEVLVELRDLLEAELERQGKLEWAREEFEHVRTATPPPATPDRWRRVSGIHRIRNRRQLAIIREMWQTRERLASASDISPTRLIPDASIMHVATSTPSSLGALAASSEFIGRASRRHLDAWWTAIQDAQSMPESELPEVTRVMDGPPPPHRWAERDRDAADRLIRVKALVVDLASELGMPTENLLQPDAVRRLAWQPPEQIDQVSVAAALREHGARAWQVELTAAPLAAALLATPSHDNPDADAPPVRISDESVSS
jgi:ribonuclease D